MRDSSITALSKPGMSQTRRCRGASPRDLPGGLSSGLDGSGDGVEGRGERPRSLTMHPMIYHVSESP